MLFSSLSVINMGIPLLKKGRQPQFCCISEIILDRNKQRFATKLKHAEAGGGVSDNSLNAFPMGECMWHHNAP
jgi:hypothetical protein